MNREAEEQKKWFESEEGKRCADLSTLSSSVASSKDEYLRNRLMLAFQAGVDAGRTIQREEFLEKCKKPEGFEDELSSYRELLFDSWSGEPVSWGFFIKNHAPEIIEKLRGAGLTVKHIGVGRTVVLAHELLPDEAVFKYGPVSELVVDQNKKFKHVCYGTTHFLSSKLDPRGHVKVPKSATKRVS